MQADGHRVLGDVRGYVVRVGCVYVGGGCGAFERSSVYPTGMQPKGAAGLGVDTGSRPA